MRCKPFRLGFEGFGRSAGADIANSVNGYPPYNIERIAGTRDEPDMLRLVLAVAGFPPEQLEIAVADGQLSIRGDQKNDGEGRHFLHRGIAARRFQRAFLLADGLEVLRADLNDGLLSIQLTRRSPAASVRRIEIGARDS